MAQKFWIPKSNAGLPSNDFYDSMEISIPDACPHCNNPISIVNKGKADNPSTINNSCEHTSFYADIWDMRIQGTESTASKVSNMPLSCAKCGDFHDYAVANQKDGSFVCYQCRH
jgi:hypothetical protein